MTGRVKGLAEIKPVLPCGSCDMKACSILTSEGEELRLYTLKPCDKYCEFRKQISLWWDEHPEELDHD